MATENQDQGQMEDELEAMALWESHLSEAANRWKEGVSHSQKDYRRGLASFLGVSPDDISENVTHEWQDEVESMSADEFAQQIKNEGHEWLEGLYRGATGNEPPERVKELAREIEREALQGAEGASGHNLAERFRRAIHQRAEEHGQTGGQAGA